MRFRPAIGPRLLGTIAAAILLIGSANQQVRAASEPPAAAAKDASPTAKAISADAGEHHAEAHDDEAVAAKVPAKPKTLFQELWYNFTHNLFKPILLFFYLGFLVPILKVKLDFPHVIYQGLTIYLLVAIGWKGGEELARLSASELGRAAGFMLVGFCLNFVIGIIAYLALSAFTKLRRIDKATVAGYYGSDSAGTFVTCVGALATANILTDAYMPVMLAVMEIPGCLVALYLVSRLRHKGMDPIGNMPDEAGYDPKAIAPINIHAREEAEAELQETSPSVIEVTGEEVGPVKPPGLMSAKLLHEVFLNPGLYLLFGGILIGLLSGFQNTKQKSVTEADDRLFVALFEGILCLFLLEMGMTASRKLKDLRTAGIGFVLFGLIAPNVFATLGITVAHIYAHLTHAHFEMGTYVLFAVLCAAASYIAVPAVQRIAIPEASPSLPLAASLGLTFSYNVTIGIPVYILIANVVIRTFPV